MKKIIFVFLPFLLILAVYFAGCEKGDKNNKKTQEFQVEPIVPNDEVIAFFEKHLPTFSGIYSDCFLVDIDKKESACFIINSVEEFGNIFSCSSVTLPAIDFDSYTLIVGRYDYAPGTVYNVVGQNLIVESKKMELNLNVIIPEDGLVRVNNSLYIVENWSILPVDLSIITVKLKYGPLLMELIKDINNWSDFFNGGIALSSDHFDYDDLIALNLNQFDYFDILVPAGVDVEDFVLNMKMTDIFECVEYNTISKWEDTSMIPLFYWGIYPKIRNINSINVNLISENKKKYTLTGTKWKLTGIVDADTNTITEIEPNCDECFTLAFATDSTFYTYAFINKLQGVFKADYEQDSFHLLLFGGTKAGELGNGNLYIDPFWEYKIQSFSFKENELNLYYDEQKKYLLFKPLKP